MSLLRLLARRIVLGFVAAWAVLTGVFAMFTVTEDWALQMRVRGMMWGGASEGDIAMVREQYLARRGYDRPLFRQYVDWMGNMLSLDWGHSFATGEAVFPLVLGAAARTAQYVVPAIGLGIALGVSVGLYAALRPDSRLAGASLGTAYALFALPNFWIGAIVLSLSLGGVVGYSAPLFDHLLPIALVTTTLCGGYAGYARAYSLEHASDDSIALVRAKGAGPRRVARHVLRNAAIPIVSVLFSEAFGLLVLSVFVVETLFGIEGFGLLLFDAVYARDLPVLLGGTMLIIAVGVAGNVLQDLSYGLLDPRVDTGTR